MLRNCIIRPREDETDPLFTKSLDGSRPATLAHLDGYAVIPVEEYEALTRQPTPGTHEQPSEAAVALGLAAYNEVWLAAEAIDAGNVDGVREDSIRAAIRAALAARDHTPTAPAGEATVSEAEVEAALSELVVRVVSRSSYAVGELRDVAEIMLQAAARARAAAQGAGAQPVAWEIVRPDGSHEAWLRYDPQLRKSEREDGYVSRPLYAASPDAPRPDIEAARREAFKECVRWHYDRARSTWSAVEERVHRYSAASLRALGDRP